MSTIENFNLSDVRVTGVDGKPGQGTPNVGVVAGLKYFRAFDKNGTKRPAHVELIITRNHVHYDANGNQVSSSDTMKLEAWNNDNDKGEGRGIADYFAKWYSVGKLFSISNARLRVYKRRVYTSEGAVVNNTDGTPILINAMSIVVGSIRQLSMHQESAKTIAREVANYNAGMTQKSFFSRPPNWNNPAHADAAIWKEIIAFRKTAKYAGTDYYGNAKVCMVSGANPADGYPVQTTAIGGAPVPNPIGGAGPAGGQAALLNSILALLTPEQQAAIAAQQGIQPAPAQQVAGATGVEEETPF